MEKIESDTKLGRVILSGCLFISWAVCISIRYLIPAVIMSSGHHGNPEKAYVHYCGYVGGTLSAIAWFQLIAAILLCCSVFIKPLIKWYKEDYGITLGSNQKPETTD